VTHAERRSQKTPTSSSKLRAALIAKTGWSKQTLSARVQGLRRVAPVSTPIAQAVIAHQQGLQLHRYLDEASLKRVQEALPLFSRSVESGPAASSRPKGRRGNGNNAERVLIFPSQFKTTAPLLSDEKVREAKQMASLYPILYVIENSMRELIKRVLGAKYGIDWWKTALTGGKGKSMRDTADARRNKEDQMNWHQRRGAHPIDYVDLGDLGTIIAAKQDDFFPVILGDCRPWFDQFMRELEPSRNVLCHMNPLDRHNAADLKVKAEKWRSLISGSLSRIP